MIAEAGSEAGERIWDADHGDDEQASQAANDPAGDGHLRRGDEGGAFEKDSADSAEGNACGPKGQKFEEFAPWDFLLTRSAAEENEGPRNCDRDADEADGGRSFSEENPGAEKGDDGT